MHDLFNPAGLRMLEDQEGAIAYGYVAPRVFYARFVGRLSAELGDDYVRQLELAVGQVPALAYFADASALEEYDPIARTLAGLSSPVPSAAHREAVRARCHAAFARRRRRASVGNQRSPLAPILDAVLLLVVGVYMAGAITEAVRLGNLL